MLSAGPKLYHFWLAAAAMRLNRNTSTLHMATLYSYLTPPIQRRQHLHSCLFIPALLDRLMSHVHPSLTFSTIPHRSVHQVRSGVQNTAPPSSLAVWLCRSELPGNCGPMARARKTSAEPLQPEVDRSPYPNLGNKIQLILT